MKLRKDVIDMSNKTYGQLIVYRVVGRKKYRNSKNSHLVWVAYCKGCGRYVRVHGYRVRRGQKSCIECTKVRMSDVQLTRIDGVRIDILAKKAGVSRQTMYKRIARGWPKDRLTEPKHKPFDRR